MVRLIACLALLLASCASAPLPANPPLWEVTGPHGQRGWLFGTIHALARPVAWRTPRVGAALAASDRVVVEVADIADAGAVGAVFARLGRAPGLPPLSARVAPGLRAALAAALARARLNEADFADTETWAAALTLARALAPAQDGAYGIDRAVIAAAGARPVEEMEGAAGQLGIFDRLPQADQRDLLAAVVRDADTAGGDDAALADAWTRGDMAPIAVAARTGLLAEPGLRRALFTARNRAWTARIAVMLRAGERPFVAVGAAHMAGPDGLPALLARAGFTVRRVE